MLKSFRAYFEDKIKKPTLEPTQAATAPEMIVVRRAAAALLIELAYADDEFVPAEKEYIERALVRQFGVAEEEVHQLVQLAEREQREAVDHYQFTSLISEYYDLSQKMVLAEVMWGLVASDGKIANHESYLVRKLSKLLEIEPGYLAEARRRAFGRDSTAEAKPAPEDPSE